MTLEFLPEVRVETDAAALYYEREELGLGERFETEVKDAVQAILAQPLLWRVRPEGYRRVNLPSFRYYLAYEVNDERVRIIAVFHAARQPDDLQERLHRL